VRGGGAAGGRFSEKKEKILLGESRGKKACLSTHTVGPARKKKKGGTFLGWEIKAKRSRRTLRKKIPSSSLKKEKTTVGWGRESTRHQRRVSLSKKKERGKNSPYKPCARSFREKKEDPGQHK